MQALFSPRIARRYAGNEDFAQFALVLDVQPSTAATQSSSSAVALSALGVFAFDESNKRVTRVSFDHPLFALMRDQFGDEAPDTDSDEE